MTLDEAIIFAEQVAYEQDELYKKYNDAIGDAKTLTEDIRTYRAGKSQKCSENHRQLAEWLKDYRRLKEQEQKVETEDLSTKSKERTGHWIANKAKYYPGWVHCSECGEDWTHDGRPPYCPACGARMAESDDKG